MRILSIETSCDETAVAILEAYGTIEQHTFTVLADELITQAELHSEYGGVFPALAKREHARMLTPLTQKALESASLVKKENQTLDHAMMRDVSEILEREPDMLEQFLSFAHSLEKPAIDAIAVTEGPGLAPALWVGVNFAKALARIWDIPVIPINHMEGHIVSSLLSEETRLGTVHFPALALLISGGHTELVLIEDWLSYRLIGQTRDDAVGEAFDKVARMLDLGYPGGPEIARLAQESRVMNLPSIHELPRPMLHSGDCDFSFSGLKTAVLYALREIENLDENAKRRFAQEFEDTVVEILIKKTRKALDETGAQTLILGGGVSANTHIRTAFKELFSAHYPDHLLYVPENHLTTDNALMIAVAAFLRSAQYKDAAHREPVAQGNLKIHA